MAKVGPKPGERRGGRQKGTPNKIPSEVREVCQQLALGYSPSIIEKLAELAGLKEPSVVGAARSNDRLTAMNMLLDRGIGKAVQDLRVGGSESAPPVRTENVNVNANVDAEVPTGEYKAALQQVLTRAGLKSE